MQPKYHYPVMSDLVQTYLAPQKGMQIIDCTLGDAGHTISFLESGARVLGLEVNQDALTRAVTRIKDLGLEGNFKGVNANFRNLEEVAKENNFTAVNGVLFDLGLSSYELDEASLGLSFQREAVLDMRLDSDLEVTAADLLNTLPEWQLAKIIYEYGGERFAKKFAKEVVALRSLKKIQTTKDLADLLLRVAPFDYEQGRIHPATRTFQALRIAVNDEMSNLVSALPQAARLLLPGGRMVIISFHSLEDKIAKSFGHSVQPIKITALVRKPLVPSETEVLENVRSRSAKMRVYERI